MNVFNLKFKYLIEQLFFENLKMVGRKCSVEPAEIIAAVLRFKDRVIDENQGMKSKSYIIFC